MSSCSPDFKNVLLISSVVRHSPILLSFWILGLNFVTTKPVFCHDKSMLVVTKPLSQVCRDKSYVTRSILLSRHVFAATKVCLSWQNYVCRNNKIILLWQKFCRDKHTFVMSKDTFCHDKHEFVVTKLLLWQKWCLWQLPPIIHCMVINHALQ